MGGVASAFKDVGLAAVEAPLDIATAIAGGISDTDLAYAPHVPGRMTAVLSASSCGQMASANQAAVCNLLATRCSNLQFNCGNFASITIACDLSTSINAAKLVLAAEPQEVRDQYTSVYNQIEQTIANNCANDQVSTQTLQDNVSCTDSSGVVLNALNNMNLTSACATSIVTSIIANARREVADKNKPGPPPISNTTVLMIAGVVAIVLFILILAAGAIVRQRNTGK